MLFSPQRDIVAYLKHYREEMTPVLTFPPDLHRYHRNGFPALIAFDKGELVYNGSLHPYEETFRDLGTRFWREDAPDLRMVGPLHVANWFVYENRAQLAIHVVPDGDVSEYERMQKRSESGQGRSYRVMYEDELTADDLQMNLYFQGHSGRFTFSCLKDRDVPIHIDAIEI